MKYIVKVEFKLDTDDYLDTSYTPDQLIEKMLEGDADVCDYTITSIEQLAEEAEAAAE